MPTNSSCFPPKISVDSQKKVFTPSNVLFSAENIGGERYKKGFHVKCIIKKRKGRMLINETSGATLPLTLFRGLARVSDIRARVPHAC